MTFDSTFALPCPATDEDFRKINIALSDPQRGFRDLYGKMAIPDLFTRPLGELVNDAEARSHAVLIAKGLPYVFFLLSVEDAQRFLFLLMDAKLVVASDTSPVTGFYFTPKQLREAFVPPATLMCQHMLRMGFAEDEIRDRMISILDHPGISPKVAVQIRKLAHAARLLQARR